jgi:hypothetical protein
LEEKTAIYCFKLFFDITIIIEKRTRIEPIIKFKLIYSSKNKIPITAANNT